MSRSSSDVAADYGGPVKRFIFRKRTPGLSAAEFHGFWHDRHARQLADTPDLRRHLRRYELYERLTADETRERSDVEAADAGFDHVAVMWFDSQDAVVALAAEPAFRDLSTNEVPRFRDPQVARVVTRTPDVIVGPPGGSPDAGMTLLCILRRLPGMSLDRFHDHWLNVHGPLFQDIAELHDPLLGYEQNHGLDLPGAEYDGLTQQWFHSLEAWGVSLGVAAHREVVEPDVASFLDPAGLAFVVAGPPTVVIP